MGCVTLIAPAMRPLSASECITPAIERTKSLLFRPFQWRPFLKLTAVAFFAEIGSSFSFSSPSHNSHIPGATPATQALIVAILVGIFFVALIIGIVMFYVSSRLQLVTFSVVATRQTTIAPIWRRYSHLTWRWLGLKLLFFLICALLLLVTLGPVFFSMFKNMQAGEATATATFFSHMALFIGVGLLVAIIVGGAYLLLRDFTLPSLALEDISISAALSRVRSLVAAEPGEVAVYILLRFLLGLVAAICAEILIALTLVVTLIPFAIIGGVLWFALRNAGLVGTAALIASAIVGTLIFLIWMAFVTIGIVGTVFVFNQAYALYFLGGRYPLLGSILEPAPLQQFTPPPPFPVQPGDAADPSPA
jgi:hypothetical protein